ncbi:hypothetical protein [Nonomuraea sp. NPDC049504]|uniref:hypothetical protein n=1 Tax=Nonomuraea sp. NPDC049504 TaxID=3154729 RepID=UPI00342F8CC7
MTKISRIVLEDIARLRAAGLTPGQISRTVGANILTITEAINQLEQEAQLEAETVAEPKSEFDAQPPPWHDGAWLAERAAQLGEDHASREALQRVAFFDLFHLSIDDMRDGYSASALYQLYLRHRVRGRMR